MQGECWSAYHRPHSPELQSLKQPLQTTAPNLLWAPGGPARLGSVQNCSHNLCVDIQEGHREDSGTALCPEAACWPPGSEDMRPVTSFRVSHLLGSPGPWLFCPRDAHLHEGVLLRRAAAGLLHELAVDLAL